MPNKFSKADEGKRIRIIDTLGASWILKDGVYTIKKVITSELVRFYETDEPWSCSSRGPSFEILKEQELKKGDKIIIINDTQSFKKETEKEIIDFIDNDKDKILVEGLLPGGWLKSVNVIKLIDYKTLRVKSIMELLQQFEDKYVTLAGILKEVAKYDIFGKRLEELEIKQTGSKITLIINKKEIILKEGVLIDASIPIPNLTLEIYNRKDIVKIYGADNPIIDQMKNILGKQLDFNFSQIMKFLNCCQAKGYITIESIKVPTGFIKVAKKLEIKNEQNEKNLTILF